MKWIATISYALVWLGGKGVPQVDVEMMTGAEQGSTLLDVTDITDMHR